MRMPSEVLKTSLFVVAAVDCAGTPDAHTMHRRITANLVVACFFMVRIRLTTIMFPMIPLLNCAAVGKLPAAFLQSPAIQARDSERIGLPVRFREASAAHASEHFFRRGKALDRSRKISIGPTHSRDHGAHARENLLEINAVKLSHDSLGLAEIENAAFATGAQNADDFAQSGVVIGEVAETEGRGDQVEVVAGKRKIERVGFDPARPRGVAVGRSVRGSNP